MTKRIVLLILGLLLLTTAPLVGQEEPQPSKFSGVDWYSTLYIKLKPDKVGRVQEIVYGHLLPAGQAAGNAKPQVYEFSTGEWNMVIFFPMPDGPSSLAWERAPSDAKFFAALAKQEGSPEKAQALFMEFLGCMQESRQEVARKQR